MSASSSRRRWLTGMAFLLPNIAGFVAFTLVPLGLSIVMAVTDWDILRHNVFRHEPLAFVGFDNFIRLFRDAQFWVYLENTFFLMLGLPFAIAGSLIAALLLTRAGGRVGRRASHRGRIVAIATVGLTAAALVLMLGGVPAQRLVLLFALLALTVLALGVVTGGTAYRTLFYLPHFTAGVATFVLWKKLYNTHTGPINIGLAPVLDGAAAVVRRAPQVFTEVLPVVAAVTAVALLARHAARLRRRWHEGDIGFGAVVIGALGPAVPFGCWATWQFGWHGAAWAAGTALAGLLVLFIVGQARPWGAPRSEQAGMGAEVATAMLFVPAWLLLGAAVVFAPALAPAAAAGFEPPDWLGDYGWAKPALMIMALWAAIGSNNMILYLAGLNNIPPELYEAAEIDGASAWQRFWHITWPQLAPVTFFVSVMGIIYGLQGGFEMARTMTMGGPAGSTTTLSYYVFVQAFEAGRLGYAAAVSWVMFALVFVLSLLNFRLGNRYAND